MLWPFHFKSYVFLTAEVPDNSFTRSISNPEAVMRRRRQQKLEKKLLEFSHEDGRDSGGTLKVYGAGLCPDVPYKTLLLSVNDPAALIVEEMLEKYGLDRKDASGYCLVQVTRDASGGGSSERCLDDLECPLAILMNSPPSGGENDAFFKYGDFPGLHLD